MKFIEWIKKYQNVFIAAAALCGMFYGIHEYSKFNSGLTERKIRGKLLESLIYKKSQLEKSLYSRIYYTKSVATYISVTPENSTQPFYQIADEFTRNDTVISTMALSKDCIIGAIYPLPGHEKAIGLNLLAHPKRKKIVEETVRTKKTFIAGPVELIEGGIAFISYTPIFTRKGSKADNFWGVTDIVIYRDKLFNEAKIVERDDNFKYALRGVDGTGSEGDFFWGDSTVFASEPVKVEISLPTGSWTFASSPIIGWPGYVSRTEDSSFLLYVLAFIIAILIWLLANAWQKIRQNEKELKALFGAMEDLVILFDREGRYLKIAPTNETHVIRPPKELLGKTMHQVFDREQADFAVEQIQKCLETKSLIVYDYPIVINSRPRWFEARISYVSDDTVMFVAHDHTEQKQQQDALQESETQLKQLNATKDKFFSIIAHDLRSPFHGLLNLTEIMAHESGNLTVEEFAKFSDSLNKSADNLYKLLNNLLDWSLMQQGSMEANPARYELSALIAQGIEPMRARAAQKGITLLETMDSSLHVHCDEKMIVSVIRNLISNAVKYTHTGGTVTVSAVQAGEGCIEVRVADTGIGIEEREGSRLFKVSEKVSLKGTDNELGTGLGLILCREFVEKNNGRIRFESKPGQGTTFFFTLRQAL